MERYIGLDVHGESCTLVVLSGTGKLLKRELVETNGAALKESLRGIAGPKRICLEEGVQSAWLYELLSGEADDVVVTIPAKRAGSKDDARDAAGPAENLRIGADQRRVYKGVGPYSELRAAVKSYRMLRSDVQRTKTRLKAIFRSRGLRPPGGQAFHEEKHEVWVRKLPKEHRLSAEVLLSELETLEELWGQAEQRLHEASKGHRLDPVTSSASSLRPGCTDSIRRATCATSSACWPTGPEAATSNSRPGTLPGLELASTLPSSPSRSALSPCPPLCRSWRARRRRRISRAPSDGSQIDSTSRVCRPYAAPARRGPCIGYVLLHSPAASEHCTDDEGHRKDEGER